MAHPHEQYDELEGEEIVDEFYIEDGDVLAEMPDDGDAIMDEEEEDDLGELPGPSHADEDDEPVTDTSISRFSGHTASVFAVTAHPSAPLVASGGEDDLGYIWNVETGEILVKLTGHIDSVTNAAFSADGEMIATGGMDGKVRVWRRRGKEDFKNWEFLTELQGPDEIMVRSA
jgi:ribosome assembly protein SQT1